MQRSTHKTINTQEGTKQYMQRAAQLTGNNMMVHITTHQHTHTAHATGHNDLGIAALESL